VLLTQSLHWGLALVPVLVMLAIFVWLDAFALMSLKEVVVLLLLGGLGALAAYPVSGKMLDTLPIGFSLYSRFVAPWIEEAIKGAIIVLLFRMNRIGYKLDAVIAGFAIGAGFSVIENIFYLSRFPELTTAVWLVRGLGTAVMHGATTAILASVAHELCERSLRKAGGHGFNPLLLIPGYIVAALLHMLFNQFPGHPMEVMIATLVIAPVVLIGVMRFGEGETQQWLIEESESHRQWLEELEVRERLSFAPEQRLAALAARSSPAEAALIRDYCMLKTELVLTAEEELLDRDRKLEEGEEDRLRNAFARLEQIRLSLGRTEFAALRRLLPFSSNDEWELAELKELVDRD